MQTRWVGGFYLTSVTRRINEGHFSENRHWSMAGGKNMIIHLPLQFAKKHYSLLKLGLVWSYEQGCKRRLLFKHFELTSLLNWWQKVRKDEKEWEEQAKPPAFYRKTDIVAPLMGDFLVIFPTLIQIGKWDRKVNWNEGRISNSFTNEALQSTLGNALRTSLHRNAPRRQSINLSIDQR